ncbi:MAG: ferredoxin [Candidatus Omnitrophota bacterium]
MKVKVSADICTGCTLCVQACPEVFSMKDDKAAVYVNVVPEEAEESCRNAAQECPVEAIKIVE